MQLKIYSDGLSKQLARTVKSQMPWAIHKAINRSTKLVLEFEKKEMVRAFKNPTRWTLNGFRVEYSKNKLSLNSMIELRTDFVAGGNPVGRYLRADLHGGSRSHKPFENRLKKEGVISANEYLVPNKQFVNSSRWMVSKKQIEEIGDQLKKKGGLSVGPVTYNTRYRYFIATINGHKGVWQAKRYESVKGLIKGGKTQKQKRRRMLARDKLIRLVFTITKRAPNYREIYNFEGGGVAEFRSIFPAIFKEEFASAIESRIKRNAGRVRRKGGGSGD